MPPAGLNVLKRTGCSLRNSTALCEQNSSSLLPNVMKSLSTHICMCITTIQAWVMEIQVGMLVPC